MTFVQDDGLYAAFNRYDDFIRRHEELYILFLKLGVETNMPVIIKYPSRCEGKVRSIIELDNKIIWSQNLLDAMTAYGEYSKIPEPEKSSHIEVAYFEPNPIPDLAFEWDKLLPLCRR